MSWSTLQKEFIRVDEHLPCPICKHTDGCLIHRSGTYVLCYHKPSNVYCKIGYKHMLNPDDADAIKATASTIPPQEKPDINFSTLVAATQSCIRTPQIVNLASSLGVSVQSLRDLGIGWSASKSVYTFPMYTDEWDIVGVSTRSLSGEKKVIFGSSVGLYLPTTFRASAGITFVCEGLSDTAAACSLGLNAVGRFNCGCGEKYLCSLLSDHTVYIISDNGSSGIRGASELCISLAGVNKSAHVIYIPSGTTPMNDLRDMIQKKGRPQTLYYIIHEVSKHASR